MKNLFLFGLISISLLSCNDDLDLVPKSALEQKNFFKTDNDAVLAVNGVYATGLDAAYSTIAYIVDVGADATQVGLTGLLSLGLSSLVYDESLGTSYSIWSGSYHGIANANTLIDVLADPGTPVSDGIRKRVTGEAKFFRAHRYFLLVSLFGDIPLVLKSGANAGIGTERADVHTVYARIVDDLKSASENLNEYKVPGDYSTEDQGRVTQQSAYGLLAKVYLYWAQTDGATDVKGKLDSAVYYANQVTGYALEARFLDNWDKNNKYGKESLFALNYVLGQENFGDGGNHLSHCTFFTTYSDSLTPHTVVSDRTFYDRFDDRDQRKKGSFIADIEVPKDQVASYGTHVYFKLPRFQKYVDPGSPQTSAYNRELNASILRYADILLIKAEAINERDQAPNEEAYEAINEVRRRAYKVGEFADGTATVNVDEVNLSGLDYLSFRKQLRRERYFEFVYEQQRWFDLKRWKVYVKTIRRVETHNKNRNVQARNYRYGIPLRDRDLNPALTQNWGYGGSDAPTPPYADPDYEGGPENNDGWTEEEIAYLYANQSAPGPKSSPD